MMPDLPVEQLQTYRPALTRRPDFEEFWAEALGQARSYPLAPTMERTEYPVDLVEAYDISYAGSEGARIRGWYLLPDERIRKDVSVVIYHGYSMGRGQIWDHLIWALMGYPTLAVDARGQFGATPDPALYPGGHWHGWMTQGILEPRRQYFRHVYTDCVRALDFMASRPEVDMSKVCITGSSQGGGLTLAVAGLDPRPAVAMADVPWLCHMRRGFDAHTDGPYRELVGYLRHYPQDFDQVFETLSYVDAMNLAPQITCPTLMSVGLLDYVCPASTVYGTFHHVGAEHKELTVYPASGHEVIPAHWEAKLRFLRKWLG